ncbi:DUF1801 domain-containing protein [Diaminobutyricibacter tongyongensis]|uniref:DUF1801 domain-containing protein n=1 Tax=Leifsonia tongyongensis TaxID=1268043 RepID=A0A6L9Y0T2_9MICO|nr:DUF1801 domain-containing protein [Diaminobutyricibacter tongyongensis]NEN07261.1 DUF1801 domain-containing protein [Diaminobutyricibacter tongyongensis]
MEAATVDEYLQRMPEPFGTALREVRDRLVAAIPDVEQVISYRVPIFRYRGRGLVGLSATAKECSLLLMSPSAAKTLAGSLDEGSISGATVHFDPAHPLSEATVRRIVDLRIREVDAALDER